MGLRKRAETLFNNYVRCADVIAFGIWERTGRKISAGEFSRDDYQQNARVALWKAARRYRDMGKGFNGYAGKSSQGGARGLIRVSLKAKRSRDAAADQAARRSRAADTARMIRRAVGREDARIDAEALIAKLPPQQRRIVRDYYFEGLLLREIGDAWGVSKQRISQILSDALESLRREAKVVGRPRLSGAPEKARRRTIRALPKNKNTH